MEGIGTNSFGGGSFGEMAHFAIQRHGRGGHTGFFDGSARQVDVRELWKLAWHKSFNRTRLFWLTLC